MNPRSPFLMLCVAILALSTVAACAGTLTQAQRTPGPPTAVATTPTPKEPIELVVWAEPWTAAQVTGDPAGEGRYSLYLKQQFEKEHPGVSVRMENHGWDEQLRQNLMNALLTGTAPDIIVGENYFQQYGALGALVPLDNLTPEVRSDFISGTLKAAEFKGQLYGLSSFTGVFAFERNCSVVQAAGLDCAKPPQTWDELLQQAKRINQQGNNTYYAYTLRGPGGFNVGSAFQVAVYLAQAGATICKDDCTQPFFNDPKAVPVMEYLREINRYTPPGLTLNPNEYQSYSQLFLGVTAYQIAGSWHVDWAKQSGCADCRYSPIPIPSGGRHASVVVGNPIYAILKVSRHPQIAMEWIKFLGRDDVQDLVYPASRRLPTTRKALNKLRPQVDPATQVFIDELLNSNDLVVLPQWAKDPEKLWTIYNEMLTRLLTTNLPVQQIMDEAQASANQVIQ